jgi:hypothetical protein
MEDLPLVLKTLVTEVRQSQTLPPLRWQPDKPSQEELKVFQTEATRDSIFDPMNLRRNLWSTTESGKGIILCKSCLYARVLWIQPSDSELEPPWGIWGRLFQWLGPASSQGLKWTVYWFPAHMKRILPPKGHEVGPVNLNGGYCFPCNPLSIVVYRYEEATRVLLHEILHAACTDPPDASLPWKEATTETWAELFLVALCSRGEYKDAAKLWSLQSQWIANQNSTLQTIYNVHSEKDYAWRYTCGREFVLENLRIPLPAPKTHHQAGSSSRLTHPALCV